MSARYLSSLLGGIACLVLAALSTDVGAAAFLSPGIAISELLFPITPGSHIDSETVRRASRALWGDLLEAGAEIYEYQPTMFHCKVFTVDGLLVSVGSTNFDNRSFRLNDEANLNIYDEGFAAAQTAQFEADLKQSRQLTLAAWRDRPLREKAMEHVAAWLSNQL